MNTRLRKYIGFRRWLRDYEPPEKKSGARSHSDATNRTKNLFADLRRACEQKQTGGQS